MSESAEMAILASLPRLTRMASALRWSLARHLDANDLLQEGALAFLAAYPKGRSNPRAYALASAEGAMRELIRNDGWQSISDGIPDPTPSRQLPRAVRRAVRSLRRPYREAVLARLDRRPPHVDAATGGPSANALYLRYHRAVQQLRHKLVQSGRSPALPVFGACRRTFAARSAFGSRPDPSSPMVAA